MAKKTGRPSKYRPEMCAQAAKLCALGATTPDLAGFFNVATATIEKWQAEIPAFSGAIKEAKANLDAQVERRLFERAHGYTHPEVHISNYQGAITKTDITKHYAPDTTAAIFWLKNRQPDRWRDRTEFSGPGGGPIETKDVSIVDLGRRLAFILSSAEAQGAR